MNITLIGMPLAGKSTLGKVLAKKLGYRFVDIDRSIEKAAGLSLQDILDDFGEHHFLGLEEEAVMNLSQIDKTVISPGGSIIYSEKAMQFLKSISTVIFLDIPYEVVAPRIAHRPRRGIIKMKSDDMEALFNERLPLYSQYSDIRFKIDKKTRIDATADSLVDLIKKHLNP